jgi:hypothetical protein
VLPSEGNYFLEITEQNQWLAGAVIWSLPFTDLPQLDTIWDRFNRAWSKLWRALMYAAMGG